MSPEQVTGEPSTRAATSSPPAPSCSRCSPGGRRSAAARARCAPRHAHEQPPALTGSPAVAAMDRVDPPRDGQEARGPARVGGGHGRGAARHPRRGQRRPPSLAHALTRLVVLPFRVLRPDPETDFLAFSLPDAIATSLSGNASLIVRSSAVAARFGAETPGPQGAGGGCRRRSRGHGHAAARRRPAASHGAARRGAWRHAAHVAHGPVVDGRSVPAPGRHRAPRVGSALAAAFGRHSSPRDARRAARRPRLRALPARQRARAHLRRASGRARPVSALPRARSALRSRLGAARPLPSGDRQVHRGRRPTARRAPRTRSAARSP